MMYSVWNRIVKVVLMPDDVMGIERAKEGALDHGGMVHGNVRLVSPEGGIGRSK